MLYTPLTNKALRIAYDAYAGQCDSCNIPYIFHPLHLADQLKWYRWKYTKARKILVEEE